MSDKNYFLVDYENVNEGGLEGLQFLNEEDEVFLFYSENANSMTKASMDCLNSGRFACHYYKLAAAHKNALDFCLATEVGRLIAEGSSKVIIISKDQGFRAVIDYWKSQLRRQAVVMMPNILEGLLHLNRFREEIASYRAEKKVLRIDDVLEEMKEKKSLENSILKKTQDIGLNDKEKEDVCEILQNIPQKRQIYLGMLKRFGRKRGLEIYQAVRK